MTKKPTPWGEIIRFSLDIGPRAAVSPKPMALHITEYFILAYMIGYSRLTALILVLLVFVGSVIGITLGTIWVISRDYRKGRA